MSKIYGEKNTAVEALKPCTFTIKSGERVAVVGASGSGKSTLLHLLGALDSPTSGDVLYDGQSLLEKGDDELSAFRLANIGFVFQAYHLLPELTARENILLPCLLKEEAPDREYIRELTEMLGIENRLDHLPSQLSGGQQQRAAIVRALAGKPKLLLCDEPTGNLDTENSRLVMDLLERLQEAFGLTMVVVTHNQELACRFPRVLSMADGLLGGDLA